jgi:hypothetical protein
VACPKSVHPPKIKLPAKVQTNDSLPDSDDDDDLDLNLPTAGFPNLRTQDETKDDVELIGVKIKVKKSPRSPQVEP